MLPVSGCLPRPTSSAPGAGNRMAVGTQQPQILATVVTPVPVDVIDLQRHRLAEPLRGGAAHGASFRHADLAECATQQKSPGPLRASVLNEDVSGTLGRVWAWLSSLMSLAQEVCGRETLLDDPPSQHGTLATVVRSAQVAECPRYRHRVGDRRVQFLRRRARQPATKAEVRDVDPVVSEALCEVVIEVRVRLGAEKGDDLLDVGTLLGCFCQSLAGVPRTAGHETRPLPRPR